MWHRTSAEKPRSVFSFRSGAFRHYWQHGEKRIALLLLFIGAALVQPCAGASGVFESTGDLTTPHSTTTATLLPNGKVLVAGGFNGSPLASAELYDSASGTWTATGNLSAVRQFHTATLLSNGKVLVAGGGTYGGIFVNPTATAELYDPATGTWSDTGSLITARFFHTATLLPNGKVLVVGGNDPAMTVTAELYDPVSGTWTATGSMTTGRAAHTATLLPNGQVLVAGGGTGVVSLASAELYDPANGTWTATGSLSLGGRFNHTATLLPDGRVIAVGGSTVGAGGGGGSIPSVELYDPATATWTATGSLAISRTGHTASLLPSGKLLVAGGDNGYNGSGVGPLASAELYDPASGAWAETGSLVTAREYSTAALLPNGNVLVAGGTGSSILASAELYVGPATPPTLLNISTRMRVLTDDKVLIGGFIITGTELKRVLIRGIVPSLDGVGGTLSDQTLELHQGGTTVATNDNWKVRADGTSQQADIEATTIPPANDLDSAILLALSPGAYTAVLAGKDGGTGVGLVEVYDLGQGANSQPANISTRGFVDTGDNVMIGGLIVGGGSGGGTASVLLRALGPSIPVGDALSDPTLELHDGSGTLVDSNNNWKTRPDGSSQQAEIEATAIPPTNDLESALLQTLPPGNYTAIVRGNNSAVGVGLVEVYHLP
jgi:WD40 repeat protein